MPFDSFYKRSDQTARRWRTAIIGAVLLIFTYLIIPFFAAQLLKTKTPVLPESSPDAERLRRVDELCTNLPKPEKFFFESRKFDANFDDSLSVIYFYSSERRAEEILPPFIIWFNENGWQPVPETKATFKKDAQTIFITNYANGGVTNYQIYCSEKKTLPESID